MQRAAFHVRHQPRDDVFGFTEHEMGNLWEIPISGREQRAARNERLAESCATCCDLVRGLPVHDHPAQHDEISPPQIVVSQIGEIQVEQLELPRGRQHRCDGKQTERRKGCLLGDEFQDVLEAPEGIWITRVDQQHSQSQSP
ncbi:MAG TPA: hypothetical protein VN757_00910 [Steroidobacteraceae bacterium]|nr:hypothetical protein [Steroidobacteraceae bacterium]